MEDKRAHCFVRQPGFSLETSQSVSRRNVGQKPKIEEGVMFQPSPFISTLPLAPTEWVWEVNLEGLLSHANLRSRRRSTSPVV